MAGHADRGAAAGAKNLMQPQPAGNEALGTTREILRESLGVLQKELEWTLGGRLDCISAQLGRLEDRLTASAGKTSSEDEHAQLEQPGPQRSSPGGSLEVPDDFTGCAVEDERARALAQVRESDVDKTVSASEPSGTVFAVRAAWEFQEESVDAVMPTPWKRTGKGTGPSAQPCEEEEDKNEEEDIVANGGSKWILRPSSRPRLCWDVICMVLIAYDTVMIPFTFAFEPDESLFMQFVFWLALVCWTADIPLSFATGRFINGVEELRPKHIALAYLRGWFALDLLVVGSEYVGISAAHVEQDSMSMIRAGKSLRILRLMRTFRLLRLAKLQRIMQDLQDRIKSEYFHVVFSMLMLLGVFILVNHFLACMWYGISIAQSSDAWVKHFFDEDGSDMYAYFTSMHWSLTQFTPSSVDIFPKNVYERIMNVLTLLFGFVVFSSFLSSITAHMTSLRHLSSAYDSNVSLLRRYLYARSIPPELSLRILRYARTQVRRQKREIQESGVCLLKVLSKPLLMELEQQTYAPSLIQHPFFRWYAEADPGAMEQLCNSALSCLSLSAGDTVYTESSRCNRMLFLRRGRLLYIPQAPQCSTQSISGYDSVEVGGWCCEAALWTQWVHFGTVRAIKDSEIVAVDTLAFSRVSCNHRKVARGAALYGAAFVEHLNHQAVAGKLSDLPDGKATVVRRLSAATGGGDRQARHSHLSADTAAAEERLAAAISSGRQSMHSL